MTFIIKSNCLKTDTVTEIDTLIFSTVFDELENHFQDLFYFDVGCFACRDHKSTTFKTHNAFASAVFYGPSPCTE